MTLAVVDGVIAATALHHDLTLVTRNVKDGKGRAIGMRGLQARDQRPGPVARSTTRSDGRRVLRPNLSSVRHGETKTVELYSCKQIWSQHLTNHFAALTLTQYRLTWVRSSSPRSRKSLDAIRCNTSGLPRTGPSPTRSRPRHAHAPAR
jgi:hypothetical protein